MVSVIPLFLGALRGRSTRVRPTTPPCPVVALHASDPERAGVLTVVPKLKDLVDLFGVAQIVWFAWVGFMMLRAGRGGRVSVPART